jgi:uncharacterized membrane protein
MTAWNWLFVLAVVTGWTVLYVWFKRRTKQTIAESDQQTQRTFEARSIRLSAISSLVMGAALVVAMLVSWRTVPAGNEPFAVGFLAFGFAAILYGVYKLKRLRRRDR